MKQDIFVGQFEFILVGLYFLSQYGALEVTKKTLNILSDFQAVMALSSSLTSNLQSWRQPGRQFLLVWVVLSLLMEFIVSLRHV